MANKQYDNKDTVSIWKKVSQRTGNEYYSGVVYVGNVPYTITLFDREPSSESSPILTGKIELREAK